MIKVQILIKSELFAIAGNSLLVCGLIFCVLPFLLIFKEK